MRVALYARYSSELQRDASIADQLRSCREFAVARGWTIVDEFSDAAMSGSTIHRPGLQALIAAVTAGRYDVVHTEGIDRLSRDLADTATLFKHMKFLGVALHTILEGPVSLMHIGLKGVMNEQYLSELGVRTHRGQEGRHAAGKVPGGNSYGYQLVAGQLGERVIDDAQASIVRRIFTEYAAGQSPKAIVHALNREHVAGPRGSAWGPSTIHGSAQRGTGLLNNELYVGRLVWDRLKYVVHPDTRKRVSRLKPRETWKVTDVEHLRIISDDLWQAVKARQAATRHVIAAAHGNIARARRPRYLFSGLTVCAECGGGFILGSKNGLICFNARDRGTCDNRRRLSRVEMEGRTLTAMREKLFAPERYEQFRAGFLQEFESLRRAHMAGLTSQRQEQSTIDRRIREIVNAIGDGFRSEALRAELATLEARRAALVDEVEIPALPPLDPMLPAVFREQMAALTDDLQDPERFEGARERIRKYLERIVVPRFGDYLVVPNLPAVVTGTGGDAGAAALVAGACNGRYRTDDFTVAA